MVFVVSNTRSWYINDLQTDINKYAGQLLPHLSNKLFSLRFLRQYFIEIVGMLVGGAF